MADEHEKKYGPGLFTQIEETLDILESDESILSKDLKEELLEKLKYYRGELAGCTDTHPQDIDKLVEEIDIHMLQLVTGKKGGSVQEEFESAALEYEEEEVEDEGEDYTEEEVTEADDEEYEDYEDDYDLEGELGFDATEEEDA